MSVILYIHLIISNKIYTVKSLAELLGVKERTVRTWIRNGLKVCGKIQFYLIRGRDAKSFLQGRKKKFRLKPEEFFCVKCKKPVRISPNEVTIEYTGKKLSSTKMQAIRKANCAACRTQLFRFDSVAISVAKEDGGADSPSLKRTLHSKRCKS